MGRQAHGRQASRSTNGATAGIEPQHVLVVTGGRARCAERKPTADAFRSESPRSKARPRHGGGNQALLRARPARTAGQRIGRADDPAEAQADRMAERALQGLPAAPATGASAHEAVLRRKCACGGETECTVCRKTPGGHDALGGTPVPPSVTRTVARAGRPLDPGTRARMEAGFGTDLSALRIHDDRHADEASAEIGALAWTSGQHIGFARDSYRPGTPAGDRLLAHEIAHSLQGGTTTVRRQSAGESLDARYRAALARASETGDYAEAAQLLNGFSRADILARIAPMSDEQLYRLHFGAVNNPAVGPDSQVAELTAPDRPRESSAAPPAPAPAAAAPTAAPVAAPAAERRTDPSPPVREDALDEGPDPEAAADEAAIAQCVAEQGGSPRYRDGGIASEEELQRYRVECERRNADRLARSRARENLRIAWNYAREELGEDIRREVENLFSRESLAAMAVFAALFIAAQVTPVGWIADAFALVLLTLTVVMVGTVALQIIQDLDRFFSVVDATTDAERRAAGSALAHALARGGVAIFVALLTHAAGRSVPRGGGGGGGAGPGPMMEMAPAGPPGLRYAPVRVATIAQAAEASRLQQVASYAVMMAPPGPPAPAPTTESGGGGTREPSEGSESSSRTTEPRGPSFSLTRVEYGSTVLSRLAQAMRLRRNMRSGGNVAVFEFEEMPQRFRNVVRELGGDYSHLEGNNLVTQNFSGASHSEHLAHLLITSGRRRGIPMRVVRIYTEWNPCTDSCLPLIQRYYSNAEVSYSFVWERWGRQTPERNAAIDALFGE
jgi:hypothetical protein